MAIFNSYVSLPEGSTGKKPIDMNRLGIRKMAPGSDFHGMDHPWLSHWPLAVFFGIYALMLWNPHEMADEYHFLGRKQTEKISITYHWLTSSDPHPDTLFWHSFWHTIWKYVWHIYSDIFFGILSGIHSDILSDILSGILSGTLLLFNIAMEAMAHRNTWFS